MRNTVDAPAFEQAIAESLPDEKMVKGLENEIKAGEQELKRIEQELDKLVDMALNRVLKKEKQRGLGEIYSHAFPVDSFSGTFPKGVRRWT